MKIPIYQIDAFTNRAFAGNPAAICPLNEWLPEATMQTIASENNLSETAFFVKDDNHYHLRWFTPKAEIELCGHATLASAFVIFNYFETGDSEVSFETRSGRLTVSKQDDLLTMDFPSHPPSPCDPPDFLLQGLIKAPVAVLCAPNYLAVFRSEQEVRELRPDMKCLEQMGNCGVIATAEGENADFVSRFFAPQFGIDEDPVTGSAHCTLTPYWSRRLSKKKLHARQVSARGGELFCEDRGDRVLISGHAVKVIEGFLFL